MTLDLIDTVRFASSYSFKYSPRPGTKSSLIKNNISEETSSARLKKLQEVLNLHQKEFNEKFIGKTVEILINSRGRKDCQFTGRTPHLQPVHVFSKRNIIGELMMVKIESLTSYSFHGKILN